MKDKIILFIIFTGIYYLAVAFLRYICNITDLDIPFIIGGFFIIPAYYFVLLVKTVYRYIKHLIKIAVCKLIDYICSVFNRICNAVITLCKKIWPTLQMILLGIFSILWIIFLIYACVENHRTEERMLRNYIPDGDEEYYEAPDYDRELFRSH